MNPRYSGISQSFHWLTAILVLVAFTLGPGGSEQRVYDASHDLSRQWHESLGMLVLALTLLRLLWRSAEGRVPSHAGSGLGDRAARIVQWLLYAMLFAVPLTAVAGAWLQGHPLTLLAGWQIAPQLALQHALGNGVATVHTWLGDALLWLAGAHAAAAIAHHALLHDDVLVSMLPRALARHLGRA